MSNGALSCENDITNDGDDNNLAEARIKYEEKQLQ